MNGCRGSLATVALAFVLVWCPGSGSATEPLLPAPSRNWPFKSCNTEEHRFIIDASARDMCAGDGIVSGPGWAWRAWPGLVNGGQHYMSYYDAPAPPDATTKSEFLPTLTVPGLYDVWVSWRATHNRASEAPYYVFADDGRRYRRVVDQRGDEGFRAVKLGRFFFGIHRKDKSLVTLVNSEGNHSKGSDAVFIRYVGPQDVTGLKATDGAYPDKIVVRWQPVAGVRSYRVLRSPTPELADSRLVATIKPAREVYVDDGLPRGRRLYYWVRAVGVLGRMSQHVSNRAEGRTR